MDQTTNTFRYHALESISHGFRLLRLSPAKFEDVVSCTLVHAFPREIQSTWLFLTFGEMPEWQSRFCSMDKASRPLPIFTWLYAICDSRIAKECFGFDAICINQSSLLERGHQVQMMKEIFSQTDTVLVRLGEELVDKDLMFSSLCRTRCKSEPF